MSIVRAPEGSVRKMYAALYEDGRYRHFYPSPRLVGFCAPDRPIHHVEIRHTSDGGDYHAWWSAKEEQFTLVYASRLQLDICFPYGPDAEEERGRGSRTRVRVKKID